MISRTTRDNIDSLYLLQLFIGKSGFGKIDLSILHICTNRITDCSRLLMDLFQHKMLISTLFCRLRIPLDLNLFLLDLFSVDIIKMDLILRKLRNLMVSDIVYIPCLIKNRRNIRCDETSGLTLSNNQRTVFSCCKYLPRMIMEHDPKSIRSSDPQHCSGNRLQRSPCLPIIIIDQLHRNLRISLGIKCISRFNQLIF